MAHAKISFCAVIMAKVNEAYTSAFREIEVKAQVHIARHSIVPRVYVSCRKLDYKYRETLKSETGLFLDRVTRAWCRNKGRDY